MATCYIDTETTGLDPEKHEIIEIAIVTEHDDGSVDRYSAKVQVLHPETADPKALAVNGFTPETWKDALPKTKVVPIIRDLLHGNVIVGHNVLFDIGFIDALFKQYGIEHRWNHRNHVDTISLVREHLFPTGLKSASLDNTRRWLGWSTEGAHSALKDAEDCRRLRATLERSSAFKRFLWSVMGPRRMRTARR